jgi:hypothetical protein
MIDPRATKPLARADAGVLVAARRVAFARGQSPPIGA